MLSPHPRKHSHRRDGHKPGSVVRSVRRSTNIKTKPQFQPSERIPKFDLPRSPVLSMDTTSEEEFTGTSFQTEALVHSECTCHGTDASLVNATTVRSCVQHDSTGVTFPEPKTTRDSNEDLPAGLLAECCATVIVNESVQTDTDVVAQDVRISSPNRPELDSGSRSRQYTQCHANNSSHANVEPDNSVGLSEVIGNMLYDINYEMRCDKLNLQDRTSYRDDRIRSDVPDFVSTQNDSGVLDDSSPGVKIVDNLENSTSDFDLTDGGNVVAMDDSSETSGCCVGGVEDVQKVVSEDNFTHDFSTSSVVDADTMLFVALRNSATTANTTPTTIMTMDESGGLVSGNYCAQGKYVATEHSKRKECVNENVNMNLENNRGGDSKHVQDGVKPVEMCEAASVVVDENESLHTTESETDAEVARQDDVKDKAIHEATMDVETGIAGEIDSENGNIVRNKDNMKHEATINADVENENTGKTESNVEMESKTNVVEVEQDGDVKLAATIAKDVETESECGCKPRSESECGCKPRSESECGCKPRSESDIDVTNKDYMKHKATTSGGDERERACETEHKNNVIENKDDTRCDPTIDVDVETESEQSCKTDSENSVDVGQHDDVKHERGIAVIDIDVRNQGDMKREKRIGKGVDSEHVRQTESETDDEIDRQEETHKAEIAADVDIENVHACEKESENNVQKGDVKHATIDGEGKPASRGNARTESEHIKLQTDDESFEGDSGKIVQGEKSYAAVNCVEGIGCKQCDSHDETGLGKGVVEDSCIKCSKETDGNSSVEYIQDKVSVIIEEPCPQRTHGDTDTCHPGLFCGDTRHSEMCPSDCDMLSTKKSVICHPVVSPGDSKQELHNDSCRDDNRAAVNRNLSHEDNRCVDGTELCQPGVLDKGKDNKRSETEDKRVSDGDTVTQSDVDSPSPVPRDRPTCGLVNLDLYVQTESDVMLLLLMEDGVTSHEETVTDVVCLYSTSLSLACPVTWGSVV